MSISLTLLLNIYVNYLSFFFFQAEDGIRDTSVTGVQTCALPISSGGDRTTRAVELRPSGRGKPASSLRQDFGALARRSEERRVGKEWRSGGGRCACREKSIS